MLATKTQKIEGDFQRDKMLDSVCNDLFKVSFSFMSTSSSWPGYASLCCKL